MIFADSENAYMLYELVNKCFIIKKCNNERLVQFKNIPVTVKFSVLGKSSIDKNKIVIVTNLLANHSEAFLGKNRIIVDRFIPKEENPEYFI